VHAVGKKIDGGNARDRNDHRHGDQRQFSGAAVAHQQAQRQPEFP